MNTILTSASWNFGQSSSMPRAKAWHVTISAIHVWKNQQRKTHGLLHFVLQCQYCSVSIGTSARPEVPFSVYSSKLRSTFGFTLYISCRFCNFLKRKNVTVSLVLYSRHIKTDEVESLSLHPIAPQGVEGAPSKTLIHCIF